MADYLKEDAAPADGFIISFGDITAAFAQAGIPLARTLHEGNGVQWLAATARPDGPWP